MAKITNTCQLLSPQIQKDSILFLDLPQFLFKVQYGSIIGNKSLFNPIQLSCLFICDLCTTCYSIQNRFGIARIMSFQCLLQLYLPFLTFIIARADIVPGKCPKVTGTKFACTEVVQNFYKMENDYFIYIDLLIYGFLSSSPDSKSLNVFGFDFAKGSISDYYAELRCDSPTYKTNFFNIMCGVNYPLGFAIM